MRLSISARIFLGFMVVLIAFGGVMGYTFYRMDRLSQDLLLINKSYLELALILTELRTFQDTFQGNLRNTLAEPNPSGGAAAGGAAAAPSKQARWVRLNRIYRARKLKEALRVVHESSRLSPGSHHEQFMHEIERSLRGVDRDFRSNEALLDQLFTGAVEPRVIEKNGEALLRLEHRLAQRIRQLRDEVRGQVKAAAIRVEIDKSRAVWAILATVVIAVLVSLAVTIGSQLTLRPLKTLVAGTKRIGSGDYRHRVAVRSRNELGLLGHEFNSMAAAIEEREQRLIRSERMAAAGQLASHITHEIRNPLSSISLNTELLEEEFQSQQGEKAAEARQLCQAIRREVDRLTEITEEYLRFARLPRPHLKCEDINEILLDLLSFVSGELEGKHVRVAHHLEPGAPPVEADENQLRQAFLNLLRNAGEAMASGGGDLDVSTRSNADTLEVRIADTGVGISSENLPKLFEPFFSTKETGTGLGLALTQQIIQEHGGVIDVSSTPGAGTVFMVRLPVVKERETLEPRRAGG